MEHKRICPVCKKDVFHTSKYNRNAQDKKKRPCRTCSSIAKNKKYGNNKKFIERYATKGKNTGKNNAFFGKEHTEKSKEKMQISQQELDKKNNQSYQNKEFKEKCRRNGKLNGMRGKNVYSIWVTKYGKEEADKKDKIRKKKWSIAASGKNNPMYGKPSPQGSGNGWNGWYKGWFFRSLKELSYMIKEIEGRNKKWRTAETKDLRIKYVDYKGDERTYVADFFVEEKYLIEVKPEKLKSSITVRLKQAAAEQFCKENAFIYKIESIKTLSEQTIKKLHDSGDIKFTKRYEEKYNEKYNK
jgi:hypothetical protein